MTEACKKEVERYVSRIRNQRKYAWARWVADVKVYGSKRPSPAEHPGAMAQQAIRMRIDEIIEKHKGDSPHDILQ